MNGQVQVPASGTIREKRWCDARFNRSNGIIRSAYHPGVPAPSVPGRRVDPHPDSGRGAMFGVIAYGLWGLFPLYWSLLADAGALETLAHRMIWSLVVVVVIVAWTRRLGSVRAVVRDRRKLGLLAAAAVLISLNWGGYIWGVTHGHVVETALGYFIGPLVSVLLGVLLLGERLRPAQWVAVGLG